MMHDCVLLPVFRTRVTKRFAVVDRVDHALPSSTPPYDVYLAVNCAYSEHIARAAVQRRPWCRLCTQPYAASPSPSSTPVVARVQVGDFENIEWDDVMKGRCAASSYLVRKGLSRKAQLAMQIKRYLSKHAGSVLSRAAPFTVILQTWGAFDDMKVDFGGGTFASFDSSAVLAVPLRQRLEWCLEDEQAVVRAKAADPAFSHWILKSSVTNKGADIVIVRDWGGVLDALEAVPDIREWVLQRYIANPLLLAGHKFHLRVYVLCVGALQVFVFDQVLLLLAAHRYRLDDIDDIYRHLSNTARSAEDVNFQEEKFVKLLDDLPFFLLRERPDLVATEAEAHGAAARVLRDVHGITAELFAAFENEYTVFAPMSNCFELFGLDFMVDDALNVSLLEVNPGPDFQQTGDRLRSVIVTLWEETFQVVLDANVPGLAQAAGRPVPAEVATGDKATGDFTCVYSKQWSASQMAGGMAFS